MNAYDLIAQMTQIQDRLMSASVSETLSAVMTEEQENLRHLLEMATTFSGDEREKIKIAVDAFSAQLNERVQFLQKEIAAMNNQLHESHQRQRSIKAYNGGKLF